eukprot:m.129401 g.129401  ORF g.129401 m.129401 type:complete len:378 (-) comp16760_c0_seq1:155-1288(-)
MFVRTTALVALCMAATALACDPPPSLVDCTVLNKTTPTAQCGSHFIDLSFARPNDNHWFTFGAEKYEWYLQVVDGGLATDSVGQCVPGTGLTEGSMGGQYDKNSGWCFTMIPAFTLRVMYTPAADPADPPKNVTLFYHQTPPLQEKCAVVSIECDESKAEPDLLSAVEDPFLTYNFRVAAAAMCSPTPPPPPPPSPPPGPGPAPPPPASKCARPLGSECIVINATAPTLSCGNYKFDLSLLRPQNKTYFDGAGVRYNYDYLLQVVDGGLPSTANNCTATPAGELAVKHFPLAAECVPLGVLASSLQAFYEPALDGVLRLRYGSDTTCVEVDVLCETSTGGNNPNFVAIGQTEPSIFQFEIGSSIVCRPPLSAPHATE